MLRLWFIILFGCVTFTIAHGEDAGGLKTSVAVDVVGQAGLKQGSGSSDRLDVREAEFMLYAPIDHLFDGMASFAAHYEGGIPLVELHEAYVSSSKLIPRSRFRLGQFFLGVGRLNSVHRHDWPFISPPRVHKEFFADEAVVDSGGEFSYLLPLPFFLELTVGATNGFTFGHDHSAGKRPQFPTHYGHLVTYFTLPGNGGAQMGFNYLGRTSQEAMSMTLLGIDFTAKWKESQILKFLLQLECWYRTRTPSGDSTQKSWGFYIFPQYHIVDDLYLGARIDYYSNLTLTDNFGDDLKNFDASLVPTLSYRPSEFTTIRLAYNHNYTLSGDIYSEPHRYFEFQTVFLLGAHPAHDF